MQTKRLKSLLFFISLSLFLNLLSGCASEEKNANTPEGLFKIAQEYDEAERYDVALQKYAEVRNKFPYSTLATQAELSVADVHYKRESFAEAQVAYQNFRDLHPRHPKSDYVIFKTAMSFYEQLPDSIDRDLSLAQDAIYHFEELIKSFPKSTFIPEAKERRIKTYTMLAEKEVYIGDFYTKHDKPVAALGRYENVLKKYSGFGFDSKALLGASRAAAKAGDSSKQKKYSELLLSNFKDTDEAKKIKSEGL